MKMKKLFPIFAMLNLTVGALLTIAQQSKPPKASQEFQRSGNPQLLTFSGTVWQNGGKFVLRDEAHRVWYQLDDQRWASRFEGDEVRVTGALDGSKNSIRVHSIEMAPIESE